MSLFPRNFQQEFSPIFRLMDDYASLTRDFPSSKALRSFQPKFDVSESKDSYTLHGELPGIAQKDVNVEWADGNTLTVSGRSEHRHESGPPEKTAEVEARQPSVEDAPEEAVEPQQKQDTTEVATTEQTSEDVQSKPTEAPKYWVSERSVGEFSRSFSFPTRVDQDGVKASLKDGVLEIVVPKTTKPAPRRINVE